MTTTGHVEEEGGLLDRTGWVGLGLDGLTDEAAVKGAKRFVPGQLQL